MQGFKRGQAGVTLSGLIFWCVLLGVGALVGMKLFPLFKEKWTVDAAMTTVGNQATSSSTKADLAKALNRQFDISGVDRWTEAEFAELLKVGKTGKGSERAMSLEYEIRGPLFGDLDVVLNYHRVIVLPGAATE